MSSLTCCDSHLEAHFNFQLHHRDPSNEEPAAGGQRDVLVQYQPGADFASDPQCGFRCHIQQLPENIVVAVRPSQQTEQESPDDEHERKLNQTFSNDNSEEHKTFLTWAKLISRILGIRFIST